MKTQDSDELRGLQALEYSIQTGARMTRRYAFGLREEPLSQGAAYALWSMRRDDQIYCRKLQEESW